MVSDGEVQPNCTDRLARQSVAFQHTIPAALGDVFERQRCLLVVQITF